MRRIFLAICLLYTSVFCHAQALPRVIGRIPNPESQALYQMQVGAFLYAQYAVNASNLLRREGFDVVFVNFQNLTRVIVPGIVASEINASLERLGRLGFNTIIIREDPGGHIIAERRSIPETIAAPMRAPEMSRVSQAVLPPVVLNEIGHRTIRVGETASLENFVGDRVVSAWTSSTPSILTVDSYGYITAVNIGNAFISINERDYITVVVIPMEDFFIVPEYHTALLPPTTRGQMGTGRLDEYRTEPTFRLAYRFNNRGEHRGASGSNGGIDILARGANYEWMWTTFRQGGWFYSLNGVMREMVDGFQRDGRNGVELLLLPEFVYVEGVTYLQLRHILRNPNDFAVTGQRFGASADIMIHQNDYASLIYTTYGARMVDSATAMELVFVGLYGIGITPVDTLWLGTWGLGSHVDHIYNDRRADVHNVDSAMGFSFQNIDLAPGEEREFIVRFTLARIENDGTR